MDPSRSLVANGSCWATIEATLATRGISVLLASAITPALFYDSLFKNPLFMIPLFMIPLFLIPFSYFSASSLFTSSAISFFCSS